MDMYGFLLSDPLASGVLGIVFTPTSSRPTSKAINQRWIPFCQSAVGKGPCFLRKTCTQLFRNIYLGEYIEQP